MPYRETRHRCPTCGSTERFTGARLYGNSAPLDSLQIAIDRNPGAMVFKETVDSPIVAEVCGGCGRIELFATDPAALRETSKSEARDQPAGRDDTCLRCGSPMPGDVSVCPACGWSFIS
jgi:RNA polymerase subunit RPABC4/transcription elongation factor Spt4